MAPNRGDLRVACQENPGCSKTDNRHVTAASRSSGTCRCTLLHFWLETWRQQQQNHLVCCWTSSAPVFTPPVFLPYNVIQINILSQFKQWPPPQFQISVLFISLACSPFSKWLPWHQPWSHRDHQIVVEGCTQSRSPSKTTMRMVQQSLRSPIGRK